MKLDPDAAAILKRIREAGIPPWRSMPPEEGRETYRRRTRLLAGDPIPVDAVWDTTIPSAAGPIPIRVYRPDGGRPRPIFIYVHGGGWTLGDLDTFDLMARRLAVGLDCLVVSVAYRLAPEHPYPAAMDDVIAATRWLAEHGAELGGDPTRLGMGGDSAGGNITAGAVIRLRDEGGPQVKIQVLIYPATVPSFEMLSFYENAEGYFLYTGDVVWFWENYLGGSAAARSDPYACPGVAKDLSGLPPAVVITADFDPLRDDGDIYAIKLRAAGVPVVARRFRGMTHGFVAIPIELAAGRRAIRMIARATRRAWSAKGWQ